MIAAFMCAAGLLVLCAGLYYRRKEKDDAQSRKIYSGIAIAGAILALIGAAVWLA
ncbi:MAG: hypothetical protein LUD69_07575 [Oscillospiraceae bacterium]|nr:hypothetical protein [Oscillospiraceae bacterium]MCD8376789.1 hypothetical protein [Oscillospiraceae bacterium]